MPTRLPPLSSLRAFAAVARTGAVGAAADQLSVTQSAVSHQIRQLEADIGVDLIRREGRGIALTPQGERLAEPLLRGFDLIERAIAELTLAPNAPLVVSVEPTFASRWLLPRLLRFRKARPDITLHVEPSYELADFTQDRVDLGIRTGPGDWPGLIADRISRARIVPVASPTFLTEAGIKSPTDLSGAVLISDDDDEMWTAWLRAAELDGIDPALGSHLDDTNLAVAAAALGQGIALIYEPLAAAEIAEGKLVHVFADAVEMDYAYYLVHPAGVRLRPAAAAFRDWLFSEVEDEEARAAQTEVPSAPESRDPSGV
ncbi:MAG: LysR substrate-binding domain-containing protein [Pseudomonadota bacterium]